MDVIVGAVDVDLVVDVVDTNCSEDVADADVVVHVVDVAFGAAVSMRLSEGEEAQLTTAAPRYHSGTYRTSTTDYTGLNVSATMPQKNVNIRKTKVFQLELSLSIELHRQILFSV